MSLHDPIDIERQRTRELAALVLIVVGVVGLCTAAFLVSPAAGLAAVSVVLIAVGALLGLDR